MFVLNNNCDVCLFLDLRYCMSIDVATKPLVKNIRKEHWLWPKTEGASGAKTAECGCLEPWLIPLLPTPSFHHTILHLFMPRPWNILWPPVATNTGARTIKTVKTKNVKDDVPGSCVKEQVRSTKGKWAQQERTHSSSTRGSLRLHVSAQPCVTTSAKARQARSKAWDWSIELLPPWFALVDMAA